MKVSEALGRGFGLCRRGLRKPPHVLADRIMMEVRDQAERLLFSRRSQTIDEKAILKTMGASSLDSLWNRLGELPYPAVTAGLDPAAYEGFCPGDSGRILHSAELALGREVDLLGSGPIWLGPAIDWHKDYKSGYSWPPAFFRSIEYNNPERPSDVKFPWELSRLQWLIPVGQAYVLTKAKRYADAVRSILSDWISENPYAQSVNWACTMEVALRAVTLTWLFHVFHRSASWSDRPFRVNLLRTLYLHGEFIERHLEKSGVNGNHYTADAAGLVFLGLFWGQGKKAARWLNLGWNILCAELPLQVFEDGVDFEASTAYHRLVLELFLLPALYREKHRLEVPRSYRDRLVKMALFSASYSRPDGSVPLVGDADDARTLPFGGQSINDHRYLLGLVAAAWDVEELKDSFCGQRTEILWLLGPDRAASVPEAKYPRSVQRSRAYPHGGFFVMRNATDHVFIDCGPVGLAGRGGHGHNDCLSFEAVLDSTPIASDCGAYLYTASYQERNNFRSTAYHNTPIVDGLEINRFPAWNYLWTLDNDAKPLVETWETTPERDFFSGAHTGYQRLHRPVTPKRSILLVHERHQLIVHDRFEGEGEHSFAVPLHLAPGIEVERTGDGVLLLRSGRKTFVIAFDPDWELEIARARISPTYGVLRNIVRLCWEKTCRADCTLTVLISPIKHWRKDLHLLAAAQVPQV